MDYENMFPRIQAPKLDTRVDFEAMRRRQEELAGRNDAKDIFEHLLRRVKTFENTLNEDEEIGVQLANFGIAASIHIRGLGYYNPNLIEFQGIDQDGNEVALTQHISQLNFLLVAVKPVTDEPYRIGFK